MTWRTVKLGEICKIVNGSTPLRKEKKFWVDGNVPWFTIDDMREQGRDIFFTKQHVTQTAVNEKKVKLIPANSVLLCCTASIGEVAIARKEMATNQQFNSLTPIINELSCDYLYYVAKTLKSKLLEASGTTTISFLSLAKLKEIEILLPPLEEQQRIVAKLDATFAGIDIAISKQKLTEIENEKLKAKILSNFLYHKDWDKFKLNEICLIENGGTPKTKIESYWGGDIKWLTPKDMGKIDGKFVNDSERKISNDGIKNSSAKLIPSKSIILSCRAPIGYVFINNIEMSFNQGCKGLIANYKVNVEYLYYFLLSSKKLLNDLGTGTTFKEISNKVLGNIEIALPPLQKQEEIIAKLDAAFLEIENIEECNKSSKQNYAALKAAILAQELQSSEAA